MKHFFFLILLLASVFVMGPAVAGTEHTVSGFAWADTVGWMSFNCTNVTSECAGSNYGVTIDPATGQFSGYAWSDNVGWVSFTRDATMGTPPAAPFDGSENYSALWNKTTNAVTGWAKILAMGNGGWLQFRNATIDPATARITGWLWNGNTDGTGLGWVALTDVRVAQSVVNLPPQAPTIVSMNNTAVDGTTLDTGKTVLALQEPVVSLYPLFTWSPFADPNGVADSQQAYEIIFEEQLPDGTWQALYNQTVPNGGSAFRYPSTAPALHYSTTYRWRVRVQDGNGAWSPFSEWTEFRTPSHALPQLADAIAPSGTAATGQDVQLDGTVVVPQGVTVTHWQWNFGDGQMLDGQQAFDTQGNPTGTNYLTPLHAYNADGTYTVTLTVTDDAGYSVQKQMTITVQTQSELPIWQRIIPF